MKVADVSDETREKDAEAHVSWWGVVEMGVDREAEEAAAQRANRSHPPVSCLNGSHLETGFLVVNVLVLQCRPPSQPVVL